MAALPRPSLAASTPSILPPVCGQHLLEDRAGLGRCPSPARTGPRPWCSPGVVLRLEHRVVALLEQRGVVVGRRAVELGDHRVLGALVGQALDQALALQLADLDVVEGDVVVGAAAQGEPVVVDGRDALRLGLVDARPCRCRSRG